MKRKRSLPSSDSLDLDRDVPTTADDSAKLRQLHQQPVSVAQVMAAVRAAGPRSAEELRARGVTRGRPFEL
jgi:hypothetical protein